MKKEQEKSNMEMYLHICVIIGVCLFCIGTVIFTFQINPFFMLSIVGGTMLLGAAIMLGLIGEEGQ